jgi:sec-independent protein translocase protein TatA
MRPGLTEILIILGIALLLFGAGRLADIGKGLGEGIRNFKKGLKEDGDEDDDDDQLTEGDQGDDDEYEDDEEEEVPPPKKKRSKTKRRAKG